MRELLTTDARLSGAWVTLDDTVVAQAIGRAGFDVVCIDLQHGYASEASAGELLAAVRLTPALPFARVARADQIGRVLDMGAAGVVVPMVSSASEATDAVSACRYAPGGSRSWGPWWQGVRESFPEHDAGDASAACIAMIETKAGFDAVAEIAAVPGLDAIYVGPNDLALSLGLGRVRLSESAELQAAVQHVISECHSVGIAVGVDAPGDAVTWFGRGANLVLHASDVALLRTAADDAAESAR